MNSQRILVGWVDHHGATESPHAISSMLARSGASTTGLHTHTTKFCSLAVSELAGTIAHADDDGCTAIVMGRPRWLRTDAAALAHQHGDSAAALARYKLNGPAILDEMAGNFALVICDSKLQRTILAVDRTGIERLCFARVGNSVVFSSSAAAVAGHPAVGASVSKQALFDYLFCHMVPSPGTAFTGVEKLQPAEMALFTPFGLERNFYWQLSNQQLNPAQSDVTQKAELKKLLRQSVARQIDNKPIGAFLSGGTDSSTVVGMLRDICGQSPQSFSIGFQADGFDEIEYARITAKHFGAVSHELYVTPDHVAQVIKIIASSYDEPFGNASAVPTYFCARLAKEHGIEVMLAGDGGDEFFGGNTRYAKQHIFEHYWRLPGFLRKALEVSILGLPTNLPQPYLRKARSYISQARIPLPDRLESYNFLRQAPLDAIFDPEFLADVDIEGPLRLMRATYQRSLSPELVDRMMFLDHKFTLADNDLRKVTRMCELAGIEVRFPFLDEDLIEFSGALRGRQKVSGQRLRVFFKDTLRGYLPEATIAKSKHGFGLPFGLWLAQDSQLSEITQQALNSFACRGIVRSDYLEELSDAHRNQHASYYGVMIWVLVQLEYWLQFHAA